MILWSAKSVHCTRSEKPPTGNSDANGNNNHTKRKHAGNIIPKPKRQRSQHDLISSGLTQDFEDLNISSSPPREETISFLRNTSKPSYGEELRNLGTSLKDHEGRLNHQTDVLALQQEELDKQRQELDDIKRQLQTQALSVSQRFSQQDMTLFQHGESITQHAKSIKSNESNIDGLQKCLHAQAHQSQMLMQQVKYIADSIQTQSKMMDQQHQTMLATQTETLKTISELSDKLSRKDLNVNLQAKEVIEPMDSDGELADKSFSLIRSDTTGDLDDDSIIQASYSKKTVEYSPQISGSNNSFHIHFDHNPGRLCLPSTKF
jgi:hypothetical protein